MTGLRWTLRWHLALRLVWVVGLIGALRAGGDAWGVRRLFRQGGAGTRTAGEDRDELVVEGAVPIAQSPPTTQIGNPILTLPTLKVVAPPEGVSVSSRVEESLRDGPLDAQQIPISQAVRVP
ncbi:MAG: hypothetical protein ACI84E_002395, partial [Planctomycetota bacterium]